MSLKSKLTNLLRSRAHRQRRGRAPNPSKRRKEKAQGARRHMNQGGRQSIQSRAGSSSKGLRRWGLYLGLGVVGLWAVVFGWVGQVTSDQPQLSELAQQRLAETSRLRWLQTAINLEQYLISEAPQYASISTNQPLFSRSLSVKGELAPTELLWRSGGRTVAIATSGVATKRVETPPSNILLINDETNLNYRPGDRVASPELVAFLVALSGQKQFELRSISLSNSRTVQVQFANHEFNATLGTGIDPEAQLRSINQLLEQGSSPNRYVDTTVPGRLFWQ